MHYRSVVHLQVIAAVGTVVSVLAGSLQLSVVRLPQVRSDAVIAQAQWFALPLAFCVFLMMLKRGRSSDLISGFASKAKPSGVQAALLSNTLEQTGLAVLSLAAFVSAAPSALGAVVQAFVGLFFVGRVLFFIGYALNPMWRFYGFSLNFYSSICLLMLTWGLQVYAA